MLAQIQGTLLAVYDERVVIGLGGPEPTGQGRLAYEIYYPVTSLTAEIGDQIELCLTQVFSKDGSSKLYGFTTPEGKQIFDFVSQVSGIGPKTAFSIANAVTLTNLCEAIMYKDPKRLGKIRGLSARLATRLVTDLHGKKIIIYPRASKYPRILHLDAPPESETKDIPGAGASAGSPNMSALPGAEGEGGLGLPGGMGLAGTGSEELLALGRLGQDGFFSAGQVKSLLKLSQSLLLGPSHLPAQMEEADPAALAAVDQTKAYIAEEMMGIAAASLEALGFHAQETALALGQALPLMAEPLNQIWDQEPKAKVADQLASQLIKEALQMF